MYALQLAALVGGAAMSKMILYVKGEWQGWLNGRLICTGADARAVEQELARQVADRGGTQGLGDSGSQGLRG